MASPQSLVLSPTQGERFTAGPFLITSRVQGPQSGGTFELHELAMGPATIDYHVHHTMDETLFVVEGQIEFLVAREKFQRPAGSVAFVPRGIHHGFTNHGPARARVLLLFTPSRNQHEYFRELQRLLPPARWTRRRSRQCRSATTRSWSASIASAVSQLRFRVRSLVGRVSGGVPAGPDGSGEPSYNPNSWL